MTDSKDNEQHFTHAVAKLGEKQAVVAHCAIFDENGIKIVKRAVARQTRSRWFAVPGEAYPSALQTWLDGVDAVIDQIGGLETQDKLGTTQAVCA